MSENETILNQILVSVLKCKLDLAWTPENDFLVMDVLDPAC